MGVVRLQTCVALSPMQRLHYLRKNLALWYVRIILCINLDLHTFSRTLVWYAFFLCVILSPDKDMDTMARQRGDEDTDMDNKIAEVSYCLILCHKINNDYQQTIVIPHFVKTLGLL